MNTRERAGAVASAASRFHFLGSVSSDDLLELVRLELGHPEILDDFQPYGARMAKALAPDTILHVLSGNTPAAGLQTLIRGLLLGSHNLCKVPSVGIPELEEFRTLLPPELQRKVELSPRLSPDWAGVKTRIVFGTNQTVEHFSALSGIGQTFIGHEHKDSIGVVFADPTFESAPGAARDASLFDQQGCLSPQCFYVAGDARGYAARLAEEMAKFSAKEPRGRLSVEESATIRQSREVATFRRSLGEPVDIWASEPSTEWTVVFDGRGEEPEHCANRFVIVKPLPEDLAAALGRMRQHLSTCGIWPCTIDNARKLAPLGALRICAIGKMQLPPWTWHHDAKPVLAPLVRWIDFEP